MVRRRHTHARKNTKNKTVRYETKMSDLDKVGYGWAINILEELKGSVGEVEQCTTPTFSIY
jgi:hypothetical protein